MEKDNSHLIFYYPFSYRQFDFKKFHQTLTEHQFYHFQLDQQHLYDAYYGLDGPVAHDLLKQFYYPFIEEKLFSDKVSPINFNRFTKAIGAFGQLKTKFHAIDFTLHSADVNLCPFGTGIVALRIQLHQVLDVTTALSFAHYFRVLVPKIAEDKGASLYFENVQYEHSEDFILSKVTPFLKDYFIDYERLLNNDSKMPFFEDERMYVSGFIQVGEPLTEELLYRVGQLNGYDDKGAPYISSTNPRYIEAFVQQNLYDRWMPDFAVMTTLQAHMHITTMAPDRLDKYASNFHTVSYYTVLIHYFYKMMLLKITFEHSELKFSKDKDIVEELIEQITKFATRYYFSEISTRTEGTEMAQYFRRVFRIDEQYREIKETLDELYRVQEDRSNDRLNELIFLLTVFSMISGIYGMNLVVEKLGDPFKWSGFGDFTFFEWTAVSLILIGLVISALLVINQVKNLLSSYIERRKRAREQ